MFLAALFGATTAGAQSPASVAIPQISRGPAGPAGQAVRIPAITGAGANGQRRSDAASAPAQVGNGVRPATALQALSSPAQGRAVDVPALTGADQCEPGASLSTSKICEQRLEYRADQFGVTSAAPVTAEGRLLMLMAPNARQGPDAAGRIGDGGPDLRDFVGQAAGQVSTALDQQGAAPSIPAEAAARQTATGLPATVVINPAR
jgi:hypothetical protein